MVPKAAMARTTLTDSGKRAGAVAAISALGSRMYITTMRRM